MLKWISSLVSAVLFVMVLGVVARLLWSMLELGWTLFGLL
jgi:hypothetical protein